MPKVTKCDLWVRSTDMDADGVVNNAVYFHYFEQARLEHLMGLGVIPPYRRNRVYPRLFTIAETRCVFRAPLQHRDWITVHCWTSEVRNRSFALAYQIRMRDNPEVLVAEGSSVQVWLDEEGRPAPIPAAVRETLLASQREGAPAGGGGSVPEAEGQPGGPAPG